MSSFGRFNECRCFAAKLAERFAGEARSVAQLQHRHIVGTYEVGEVLHVAHEAGIVHET